MSGPELGVCYYPEHWDRAQWSEDARAMVDLGLSWVRIGEFSWALVESRRGQFDWEWLDTAVETLGAAGLRIMLCTPTAAPPRWLIADHPEVLPVGVDGRVRDFGSRRHYCLSSDVYLGHAKRIARHFAERYGQNPYVRAWQIDNEIGDHDTAISYSPAALFGFQVWLRRRYLEIDALNVAWGTVFWGQRYEDFSDIGLPIGTVAEPNPAHAFDFRCYSSERIALFLGTQAEIVRAHSPGRPVLHNFMAGSYDFDHHRSMGEVDETGFDSYPLGNLVHGSLPEHEKSRWLRTGSPDYQGFHCDLYRRDGYGSGGRLWILEQQPGPVNWARHNPSPADGAVRLWTWIAYAHGADAVLFFRWRQAPFGPEQFHTGLHRSDGTPDQAFGEISRIVDERQGIPATERSPAPVAMILDYPSRWAQAILPQGQGYCGEEITAAWYRAIRNLGIEVDVVGPSVDISSYELILVPDMLVDNVEFVDRMCRHDAHLVLGPRCGSLTPGMRTPEGGAPGSFRKLVNLTVERVESLPDGHEEYVELEGETFRAGGWREHVTTGDRVIGRFTGGFRPGSPAIVENDRVIYLTTLAGLSCLEKVLAKAAKRAGIASYPISEGLRVTYRGQLGFAFNFSNENVDIPERPGQRFLIGGCRLGPIDMAVWTQT
ncbi:MAG: beta-galactosidase [Paracoccaceae bacterium]|nr:beta-galactosidase [Paracoccaceae bacterium]